MPDYGHDLLFGTFITPTNQPVRHAVDLALFGDVLLAPPMALLTAGEGQ
jgi:hypothetical protein